MTTEVAEERLDRLRRRRQEGGTLTTSEQADLTLAERPSVPPAAVFIGPEGPARRSVRQLELEAEERFAEIPTRPAPPVFIGPEGPARRSQRELQLQATDRETQTIAGQEDAEVRKAAYETVKRLHPLPPEEEALRDKDQAVRDLWDEQAQAIAAAFPDLKPDGIDSTRETFDAFRQKLIEIEASPEAAAQFTDDLLQMGQTPDTALILDMMGIQGELAREFWAQARPWEIVAEELSDAVFPGRPLEDVLALAEEDLSGFIDEIRKGPSTSDKFQLLRHLGFTQSDIQEILRFERVVVPLDGLRALVTVDTVTNRVYDRQGRQVGMFNRMTREFDSEPEESKPKDVWDGFLAAGQHLYQTAQDFTVRSLPNFLFRDLGEFERSIYGDDWVDKVNAGNAELRDDFREIYTRNQEEWDEYWERHPELQPRKAWESANWKAGLLKDPAYWAYTFASAAPFMLAVMGTTIAVSAGTANPALGVAAGMGVATAAQTESITDALLAAGAPEDTVAVMALPLGILISSVEVVGDLPILKTVLPAVFRSTTREITEEVAKRSVETLIRKGLRTITLVEATEIMEEVTQGAIIAAAQKLFDENQPIFENVTNTVIQTAIATAPLAVFGAGVSLRRASPSETVGRTDIELEALGMVKDPETGNWYDEMDLPKGVEVRQSEFAEAITIPSPEAIEGEAGIVTPGTQVRTPEIVEADVSAAGESVRILGEIQAGETITTEEQSLLTAALEDAGVTAGDIQTLTEAGFTATEQVDTLLARMRQDQVSLGEELSEAIAGRPRVVSIPTPTVPVEAPAVPPIPPVVPPAAAEVAPEPVGPPDNESVQRVKSRISFKPRSPGITERVKGLKHRIISGWVNDLAGIDRVVSQAQKGGLQVSMAENPSIQAHLLKGVIGKATSFIEEGTFGREYWRVRGGRTQPNFTGESLEAILKDVPSNQAWEDFSTYLVSQRSVDLSGRDIETGIEAEDAQATVGILEAKYPNFKELSTRLYQYQDKVLVYAHETQLISSDLLAKLRKSATYVPFYRVFEELQDRGFMGEKMANIASPIKRIKGSDREIINPLESIVKNTYAIISAGDRNMVGVQLANLIDQSPEIAEVFERVPAPMARVAQVSIKSLGLDIDALTDAEQEQVVDIFRPSFITPGDEVTVLINGKKSYFKTDRFLREALLRLNANPSDMGFIGSILSAPARWLRAGALLSPDFMVRNPARDQLTAFVYSKYGYMPGVDFMRGVGSMVGANAEYQLYKISGAEHATLVSVDRDYLSQSFNKIMRQKQFTRFVKTPVQLLQVGRDLTETATRLGAAKRAIARGASGPEVGYTGRNISLDFATAGSYARVFNQYIPFFTAAIRGNAMMIDMFKSNPVRTSLRVFMSITLPSIALYMLNRDEEWYKETPQWQKDLFWLIRVGDTTVRIPKPFELGVLFGSAPERFLEFLDTKDKSKLNQVALSILQAGSPGWMPQFLLPIVENLTNYNFFRGQKIVPASREADLPELQYTRYTTQTSRKLGQMLQLSPAKIDNLINAWTGGLGRYAVGILDEVLKKTGVVPDIPEPSPTLADTPVVRAFVARSPVGSSGKTVNDFYDLLEEYTKNENFLKEMLERGAQNRYEKFKGEHPELLFFSDFESDVFYSASARYLRKVARELSEIRKKEDAVFDDPAISSAEKRRLIDRMERLKTEVARRALNLFPGEEPAVLQHEISETVDILGDVIDEAPVFSREDPEIHDMPALSADLGQILTGITPEDLEGMKGIPKEAFAWFEKEESETEQLSFPNVAIYQINGDPSKGTTFEDYHSQWQRQQEITDPEELKQWISDHPRASLGNLTKVQLELLREFHAADEETQAEMLDTIPELKTDPRENWLKENPVDNARLALWGQAQIYTREAYDELQRMKKSLGIIDRAIPSLILPPESSLDTHFEYVISLAEGRAWNSWETQLLLLNDDTYREWRGYDEIEDTKWYLETQIKWRDTNSVFDVIDSEDREARKSFRLANPEWADDQRRIEVYVWDKDASPEIVEAHVKFGRLLEEFSPNSAEVMLRRVDDKTGYEDFRIEQSGLEPVDEERVPIWRIEVKWRETTAEFEDIDSEDLEARKAFKLANSEWYEGQSRLEAFGWDTDMPAVLVEAHVEYKNLSLKFAPNSAETMLWQARDETGYVDMRVERRLEDEDGGLQSIEEVAGDRSVDAQVNIWRITVENRDKDAAYDELTTDGDVRERFLETNGKYRKERRRRDGLILGIPQEQIEDHVDLYELPGRGFRRERWLQENQGYYNDIWLNGEILGNSAVDFSKIPDVEYDNLYDKWEPQIKRYYQEIPEAVRLLTGAAKETKRRQLRNALFRANRGFFDDRLRFEAHANFVPKDAVRGYVRYYTVLFEGKPKGWEVWYADDRILRDNPALFKWGRDTQGWEARDFSLIPSAGFERAFNTKYITLRLSDGAADTTARYAYRGEHPSFDAEGVKVFGWTPWKARAEEGPTDRPTRGGLGRRLALR